MKKTYPFWRRIFWTDTHFWRKTEECWIKYADIGFSEKSFPWHRSDNTSCKSMANGMDTDSLRKRITVTPPKDGFRQFSSRTDTVRKSPLYHNIFIQAPDGMVLCTCDNKKADWQVKLVSYFYFLMLDFVNSKIFMLAICSGSCKPPCM